MEKAAALMWIEEPVAPCGVQREVFRSPIGFSRQLSEPMKVHTISRQLSSYSYHSTEALYFSERDESSEVDDLSTDGGSNSPPSANTGYCHDPRTGMAFSNASQRVYLHSYPAQQHQTLPGGDHPKATFADAKLSKMLADEPMQVCLEAPVRAARSAAVLLQNLPRVYDKQMLTEELRDAGFRHGCDFDALHMPGRLPGCFISFKSASTRNAFMSAFHDRRMRHSAPDDHNATVKSVEAFFQPSLFCPMCGGKTPPGANFCADCGTKLPHSPNSTM